MWVRSQDKYILINCNNIFMCWNGKLGKIVIATNDRTDLTLGIYSNKEKALKVLDKIVDRIRDIHCGNCRRDIVFQMPQDEEVKNNE